MQTKCSKLVAGIFAAILLTSTASAHPGHAPTDLAAQFSRPFAGADHFIAFVALVSVLLVALRFAVKTSERRTSKLQAPDKHQAPTSKSWPKQR